MINPQGLSNLLLPDNTAIYLRNLSPFWFRIDVSRVLAVVWNIDSSQTGMNEREIWVPGEGTCGSERTELRAMEPQAVSLVHNPY